MGHPARRPDRREHRRSDRRRPLAGPSVRHGKGRQRRQAPRGSGGDERDPDRRGDAPARERRCPGRAGCQSDASSMERPSTASVCSRCSRMRPDAFAVSTRPSSGANASAARSQSVFENAVSDRACHLLTVLGGAGVGKSRLVQEFVDSLGDEVTVLRGRCLPYGEGITYWPLAEVVKDVARAAGQDPGEQSVAIAARLAGEEKAELIAERIAAALGLGVPGGGTSEETFWAVRKLFEALARTRPAGGRVRRRPLGRADVPRPGRTRRALFARRPDPADLHRATRAARHASRLGRRQAERDLDPARAPQRRPSPGS